MAKKGRIHSTTAAAPDTVPAGLPRHQHLVTVEAQREFDLFTGEWADRVFVKLYVAARTSGLLSVISDRDWKTLCTLATYMDAEGYCYPSQQELATAMGCSRQMANERIRSLADFRFEGKPVLMIVKGERGTGGKWSRNGYRVLSLSSLRIYDEPAAQAEHPETDNDSRVATQGAAQGTVSSFLDTVVGNSSTVSSPTVTVPLDTNKNHTSEQDTSFEIRRAHAEDLQDSAADVAYRPAELEAISKIVQQRVEQRAPRKSRGGDPDQAEERERLLAFLQDFARELNDQAPLSSTITTVLRTLQRAGVPKERWSDLLYQARAITQEHSAQITREAEAPGSSWPRKNKMPYFLAVLESLVGLRPRSQSAPASAE